MGVSTDWLPECPTNYSHWRIVTAQSTCAYQLSTTIIIYQWVPIDPSDFSSLIDRKSHEGNSSAKSRNWARTAQYPPSDCMTHPSCARISVVSIKLIESQKQFDQPSEKCELCQECRSVSAIYRAIFEFISTAADSGAHPPRRIAMCRLSAR